MEAPAAIAGDAPTVDWLTPTAEEAPALEPSQYASAKEGEQSKPQWITTEGADVFFACLIVLNAIILGVDIEIGLRSGGDSGPVLYWIQFGFLVIFVIELFLRIRAYRCEFFSIRRNPGGMFDVIIVGTSVAEYVATVSTDGGDSPLQAVSVMRIFRLLRIARVARLLNICPELSLLVGGLAASIQAVFWVFCLLVVIMYICALICAMELGRTDSEELRGFFGSVGSSFWTHFMVVTLEGYPSVAAAAGEESWLWYLYFVGFILFSNVVLMNLVTGIVCESIVTKAQDDELQSHVYREESRKFEEVMLELLRVQGFPEDAELGFEDFERLVRVPEVREALNTLEICLDIEDRTLWDILDEDDSGWLPVHDFIFNLLRLRGSKDALHSLIVQGDILRGGRAVRAAFEEAEAGASNYAASLCGALQNKLLQRISELQQGTYSQGQDAPRGHGHGAKHKTRRGIRPTLQAEAVHGAPPPAEEVNPSLEAPVAASRPSRGSEEAAPVAEAPPAPSRPSRTSEEARPAAEAPLAPSRPSRIVSEEDCPVAEVPPAPSRASRISEDAHPTAAATAAASGASRSPEAPAAASAAAAAASAGSRPREEAPAPEASQPAGAEARVQGILADLESSSTEARQTLSRLGDDLSASRGRVKELEAELARREASRRAARAPQLDEAELSWPSQCSPRGLRELQGKPISARELHLLPGVEPRHRPAVASASASSSEPAPSKSPPKPAPASGGELERALHAFRRQADQPTAAASVGSAAGVARAAEAGPQTASMTSQQQQQRAAKARSECMAHRRRLEATYTSLTSPKTASSAPVAGRRGGAPRQRFLNTFHGHSQDAQSIAKAATYESSDEERGGSRSGVKGKS